MTDATPGSEAFNPLDPAYATPKPAPKVTEPHSSTTTPKPATAPQATPASTPPAEPAPAAAAPVTQTTEPEPETATATDPAAPADAGVYEARRKKLTRIGVIALVLLAVWWIKPWQTLASAGSSTTATTVTSTTANSDATLTGDVATARAYLAEHGTLAGIALPGAQVATKDDTMYAARTLGGSCVVYGLLNGQEIVPTVDATNGACTGQIATVQAALDAAASQVTTNATDTATSTLQAAQQLALAYATRTYDSTGAPTMTGLPTSLAGALVTQNTGAYVVLQVSLPDACVQSYVTAAGEIGTTEPCS